MDPYMARDPSQEGRNHAFPQHITGFQNRPPDELLVMVEGLRLSRVEARVSAGTLGGQGVEKLRPTTPRSSILILMRATARSTRQWKMKCWWAYHLHGIHMQISTYRVSPVS